MSRSEFVLNYVLNRAKTVPQMEALLALKHAYKAWDQYEYEESKREREFTLG